MSSLEVLNRTKQEVERWLRQADHDLFVARTDYSTGGFYSDCCFMAGQAAQKALNAFLIGHGECPMIEWSIKDLIKHALAYDGHFQPLLEETGVLDQYHLPTRYPNFLAEFAVPFESYTREQAARALELAVDIVQLIKQKVDNP